MPKKATKKRSKTKTAQPAANARVRQLNKKQQRTKAKKEARGRAPVPTSFNLTKQVFELIRTNWRVLGGIVLVYLILNIVFASGISSLSTSVNSIKADLNNTGVHAHPLVTGTAGFLTLVGSSGAVSSATGSALQSALIILESLVIIWALRHLLAGQVFSVKQAYYNATGPLIPFLLVLAVLFIQLLPLTFGSLVLTGIAASVGTISGIWTAFFVALLILLAAWSVYMVSSSIFAAYIVTLPNMQPRQALASAKKLVEYRRSIVLRRVLFLPVLVLVVMGIVIIPLILFATFLVVPVFYILTMLSILFVHSYLYSLYRGLLA